MTRQPSSSDFHPSKSEPRPVAPLFSAATQSSHVGDGSPKNAAIANNSAIRGQVMGTPATSGSESRHHPSQSPTLPNLPRYDAPPVLSGETGPAVPVQIATPSSVTVAPQPASARPSGLHRQQSGQNRAIADLRQTLDTQLDTSVFESSILDQLDDVENENQGKTVTRADDSVDDSIPAMVPEDLRRRRHKRQQRSPFTGLAWPIIWIMMMVGLAGMSSLAFLWMTSLPPTPDCKALSPLSADAERLHCANLATASGKLEDILAGFDLVRPWSSKHPLFYKAQEVMTSWTKDILQVAESTLYSKGLAEALALLETVPSTSPLYNQVEGKQQEWQGLWDRGNAIEQEALVAAQAGQWDVAAQQVVEMGKIHHPYWRQERANRLSLRIVAERQGHDLYQKAQQIAIATDPASLAKAMTELRNIQPQTFAWEMAQADLTQWSETIAQESKQRFQSGDIDGMLALVQALPAVPELMPQIADLMKIGYAQRQADDDPDNWTPGLIPAAELMMALSTVAQVDDSSLLYDYAQTQIAAWQQQLQDLTQLQLAQAIATTGHRYALDIAIDQASLVKQGQPRRLQAQTLIAHWRQEIERVEDRADLAVAHQMAMPGTVEALASAIDQAQNIEPNRVLRQDADVAIAQWTNQIQTIEDQPILDQAAGLAAEGNWQDAIARAETISSDRALYATAQDQIGNWRAAIVLAEHRATLAQARSLANQVRLTAAINLARSIPSSSSSVYREAQGAIAEWSRARDRIWAAQNPPSSPAPSPTVSARPAPRPAPVPAPTPTPTPSPQPSEDFEGYYDYQGN